MGINVLLIAVVLFAGLVVHADEIEMHGPSPEVAKQIQERNAALARRGVHLNPSNLNVSRPFAEYEKVKYLLVSDADQYESRGIKRLIAKNLPRDVYLVVYTYSSSQAASIRSRYTPYLKSAEQLKIIHTPGRKGFWARDNMPLPVYMEDGKLGLVDARYWTGFEPDKYISQYLGVTLLKHTYTFEGGNFLADRRGRCFTRAGLSPSIFKNYYGCSEVHRMSYSGGIGHIDERLKFVSPNVALTDSERNAQKLRDLGYQIINLPSAPGGYSTHVNSLQINDIVFVPTYGGSTDEQAIQAYESAGLTVYPARTNNLSERSRGSIHCFTMAYPDVGFNNLLEVFGAEELR